MSIRMIFHLLSFLRTPQSILVRAISHWDQQSGNHAANYRGSINFDFSSLHKAITCILHQSVVSSYINSLSNSAHSSSSPSSSLLPLLVLELLSSLDGTKDGVSVSSVLTFDDAEVSTDGCSAAVIGDGGGKDSPRWDGDRPRRCGCTGRSVMDHTHSINHEVLTTAQPGTRRAANVLSVPSLAATT